MARDASGGGLTSMADFREAALLMRAGAPHTDPATLRAIARQGLNWGRLLALAEHERALPVLNDRLREAGIEPPPAVDARLRSQALVAEFGIARLHALLEDVVSTLADGGIEVLLLKGAAIGRTRVASPRERPMADLDLLVRPPDAGRAWDLLREAGWRAADDAELVRLYVEHHHLPPLHDPMGAGAKVELHRDLFFRGHPFAFDAASMWPSATRIPLGRAAARVPRPEHLLLHGCLHFAWSHWMRFGAWTAFRDVAILAAADDMDWDTFTRTAVDARAATASYWPLRLARELTGARVPAEILRALTPPARRAVTERLATYFASRVLGATPAPWRLERVLWEAGIRPAWSGHGGTRPWERDRQFAESEAGVHPPESPDDPPGSTWRAAAGALFDLAFPDQLERRIASARAGG